MTPFHGRLHGLVFNVHTQLGHFGKEVHYQRALSLDLGASGYVVDCEKCVSTRFVDVRGNAHTISSDRIDIFVHGPDGFKAILELKQSDSVKDDHVLQAHRYARALEAADEPPSEVYVVCFPKSAKKRPIIAPVKPPGSWDEVESPETSINTQEAS